MSRAVPYRRTVRVNEVLREVVADRLERLADADERLRLVTVTAVDTGADLRHATVYVSSLADEARAALEEHRLTLQRAIGAEVRMKRTPQLAFSVDPAVVEGERVEAILRRLHRGGETPAPDGDDG